MSNDTRFKKGKSGNPAGRPKVPAEIKAARAMSALEFGRLLNYCTFEITVKEATTLSKAKDVSPALAGAAKLAEKMSKGDLWTWNMVLDRLVGRAREASPPEEPPARLVGPAPKKTYSEFCAAAGYPNPFPKQLEMLDFFLSLTEPRLMLGSRGYGKTDYITILGVAYDLYMNEDHTWMILTKERKRSAAIIQEIAKALVANDVELDKENSSFIRLKDLGGKDHSVDARSIRSGLRGPHPFGIVMDDPVTEEDVSEATRKLVERKYNEAFKLTKNILIIGQPAHAHDLYAKLRPLLKKLEVPYGSIPELDHDLEAQRAAGVDEKSIQASYFLKIISDGTAPFENIKYIDKFPVGDSAVAFLDPSHKGNDLSALSIVKGHFEGVAVVGFAAKRAWNHWLDFVIPKLQQYKVTRLCIETNGLGDMPVIMLRQLLAGTGIGVVGMDSTDPKHAVIMAAGAYAHLIHLSKESDRAYTDAVVQYEYGAEPDDPPDSLARCLQWIGLIKGKR